MVILRPVDMVEFSRQGYEKGSSYFIEHNDVEVGLRQDELDLIEKLSINQGRMLILGGGGGREALFFAREGWQVSALDFSQAMLSQARDYLEDNGFAFEGLVGDMGRYQPPTKQFDVIWFSMYLYSVVLGRERRIAMLKRLKKGLKPGGCLVPSFYWDSAKRVSQRKEQQLKSIAKLTLGNNAYENGDFLFGSSEFRHAFYNKHQLCSEFSEAGLEISYLVISDQLQRGGAILCDIE